MLADIHNRLETELLPTGRWKRFEFAEDIDTMSDLASRAESGTIIVAPYRERAGEQSIMTGGYRQQVYEQFLVGMVIREYDGATPATRAAQFDALKADVETALAGWEPPDFEPCQLADGESSPIATGVSIYVQTWQTSRYLTGE